MTGSPFYVVNCVNEYSPGDSTNWLPLRVSSERSVAQHYANVDCDWFHLAPESNTVSHWAPQSARSSRLRQTLGNRRIHDGAAAATHTRFLPTSKSRSAKLRVAGSSALRSRNSADAFKSCTARNGGSVHAVPAIATLNYRRDSSEHRAERRAALGADVRFCSPRLVIQR